MKKRGLKRRQQVRKYMAFVIGVLILIGTQIGWSYQDAPTYVTIEVQQGDSIWSLASDCVDYDTDIRDTVQEIIETNELASNECIQPGQLLKIPVKPNAVDAAKAKWKDKLVE